MFSDVMETSSPISTRTNGELGTIILKLGVTENHKMSQCVRCGNELEDSELPYSKNPQSIHKVQQKFVR